MGIRFIQLAYDRCSGGQGKRGMIDMWSGGLDDFKECNHKPKVVVDEVEDR